MAQDVLIAGDNFGNYDLALNADGTDFDTAEGFETAIPTSLFTDARAPASSVSDPKRRRGWIGNLLTLDLDRQLGGLLWLYDQERITGTVLNGIRDAAINSLNWMLEDGILSNIEIEVSIVGTRAIQLDIVLTGADNDVDKFSVLWRRTNPANIASGSIAT
jgi:phage gp46-like protein